MKNTYSEMKDSGVEWIGMIPIHWGLISNKYVMKKQKIICSNWQGENIMSLTKAGVIIRDISNPFGKMPETFDGYQYVDSDDLLMCLFDIDVTPRCVGRVFDNGITSPAYSRFKLSSGASQNYYYYYYLMLDNEKTLLHLAKNLRHSFTEEQLGQLKVPYPPLPEQTAIAAYLDEKCGTIDEIITEAKASIEEYKEWKSSVIFEAVTKGLDPNTEMKDSGVEWIGKVPRHWKMTKTKFCSSKIGSGKTPRGGAEIYTDSGVMILRSQNIYNTGLMLDNVSYISEEIDNEMANSRVFENDILLNITGGSIGRCCIYPANFPHANVNQHVCIIRVIEDIMIPKLMLYIWMSDVGQKSIDICQTGANREGMNFEQIGNTIIPMMDYTEQQALVNYLDEKCAVIDGIIAEKEALIADMEAYKKSLIFETVTGKRKVC